MAASLERQQPPGGTTRRPRVLFVDDEPNVLDSLRRTLRPQRDEWDLTFLTQPAEALATVAQGGIDTLVTDVRMPGIDGLELVRHVRELPGCGGLPIIVLTGNHEADLKRRALDLGATDLLNKPVATEDLLARLRSALRMKAQQDQLQRYSERLESMVAARTKDLIDARIDILWRLGKAAEYRDEDTGNHIVRVGLYSRLLAQTLGLDPMQCETIYLASPLHDVGKIGVPDAVLLKPGRLTDPEWQVMRRHCDIGWSILQKETVGMTAYLSDLDRPEWDPRSNPLLSAAGLIARSHHEKWNGAGYPQGLHGEQIPIEGRIVALADVYDALSSQRPYKPAFPEERVHAILSEEAGQHFDPDVFAAYQALRYVFADIRNDYADQPEQQG